MYPDRVYERMALILRDQKLPALLSLCRDDFKDFNTFRRRRRCSVSASPTAGFRLIFQKCANP